MLVSESDQFQNPEGLGFKSVRVTFLCPIIVMIVSIVANQTVLSLWSIKGCFTFSYNVLFYTIILFCHDHTFNVSNFALFKVKLQGICSASVNLTNKTAVNSKKIMRQMQPLLTTCHLPFCSPIQASLDDFDAAIYPS